MSCSEWSIMGWNGPIFQFTGKAQKLQFGPAKLELGIQIGRVLVVGVELGILLIAGVGASGLRSEPSRASRSPCETSHSSLATSRAAASWRNERCSFNASSRTWFFVRSACLCAIKASASACCALAFCTELKKGNLTFRPPLKLLAV